VDKAARGLAVLEAAVEVFAEKGLQADTMQDVADRMGVAKILIYRLYPSRQALIDALFADMLARVEAGRLRLLQPGESMTARALLPRAEGAKWLAIGCQNPMPGGRAVGFANAGMGAHAPGWLTVDSAN
jgi:AcrR family transcriptional regulator